MEENCLFCKIIRGDIPSEKVYEDDMLVAFRDVEPQAPFHFLIVPRRHIRTALDLSANDDGLLGRIFQVANKLAVEFGFAEEGFRVVNNCQEGGGQSVWHIHFHLLGGRQMNWPPG